MSQSDEPDDSKKRPFEILDFPCAFTFRIIARQSDTIVQQCTTSISGFAEIQHVNPLPQKKPIRIRIEIQAQSADQIYTIYEMLGTIEGILMVI